jgi:hypothetical protein
MTDVRTEDGGMHLDRLLILALVVSGCSSIPQVTSHTTTTKITVDGDNNDWNNIPAYLSDNKLFAVSVCHDSGNFYTCITTADPQTQMQLMVSGLTVWFDNDGGSEKRFGVKYPLGVPGGGPPKTIAGDGKEINSQVETSMAQADLELEILGPKEGDRYRLPVDNQEGILAKIKRTKGGVLVYELEVPLKPSASMPNAVNMKADSVIGFGVEVASPELRPGLGGRGPGSFRGGGPPEGPPPGGGDMGSGGGMPPGGGMGPPRGMRGGAAPREAAKLWWKVKIAE